MNNKFRHICLEDLKDYLKKNDYFESFTEEEKNKIKQNLNINTPYFEDSFNNIKDLALKKELIPGGIYVINNYQFMDDDYSSEIYKIVVIAINNESFDYNVLMLKDKKLLNWSVKYNIFQGVRGTITYLEDENGNSAFYDFKNKKYLVDNKYAFTFSEYKNGEYIECSNKAYNVSIDRFSDNNVFIITKELKNVKLKNCNNNLIKQDLINCTISISNKTIKNLPYLSEDLKTNIYKLDTNYVIEYLDRDTLTLQYQLI